MKFYIYVSDTKVDMLFAQIPRKLSERISAEMTVDLKVISLTLRPETAAATRYAKLAVLTAYLRKHEHVGSVDEPLRFVDDTLALRWTTVGSTAVWCGRSQNTLVGLTGAKQHLTGESPAPGSLDSVSFEAFRTVAADLATLAGDAPELSPSTAEHVASLAVVANALRGPEQSLEFLAVNQGSEAVDPVRAEGRPAALDGVDRMLFGSPLYVAMT